jgi:hypothetical protein
MSTPGVDYPDPSAQITHLNSAPRARPRQSAAVLTLPDNIKLVGPGETLAMLALVVPAVCAGIGFYWKSGSPEIELTVACAVVLMTSLLLAVDAYFLGTIDMRGRPRGGPGSLLAGLVLCWFVCFPLAFFRRRHFGRPNLGLLAIVVAGLFIFTPSRLQLVSSKPLPQVVNSSAPLPPQREVLTCTSPEVTAMVEGIIRESPKGKSAQTVGKFEETHYDRATETRTGQCQVKTETDEFQVSFQVKLINEKWFEVRILTGLGVTCTSPEVTAMVEDMIRQSPKGKSAQTVGKFEETHYNRTTGIRAGRCQVKTEADEFQVSYQVKLINEKWFEVRILTGLGGDPMVIQWEPAQPWRPQGPQWGQPVQPWQPGQPWGPQGQPWGQPGRQWGPQGPEWGGPGQPGQPFGRKY